MSAPYIITNESTGFSFLAPENNKSVVRRSISADNFVELVFSHGEFMTVPAFSYIVHEGDFYRILQDHTPRMISNVWHYKMKFYPLSEMFYSPLFFRYFTVGGEQIKEADFFVNANLQTCGELMLEALQKAFPEWNFVLGDIEEGTELKSLNFSGISIGEALNYIAQQFETEWWIVSRDDEAVSSPQAGSTIILNLSKCRRLSNLLLYTDHNETGHNVQPFDLNLPKDRPERLFVFGGYRNMPRTTGLDQSFRNRLRLPGGKEFIEIDGGRPGLEAVEIFDDIFPNTRMWAEEIGTRQIFSDGEAQDVWRVRGRNLDGSIIVMPNIAPGEVLKVIFQSGLLNGREFYARWNSDGWFDVVPVDQNDIILPNTSLRPRVDDEFVFVNVVMQPEFIANAQTELLQKANEFADNLSKGTPGIILHSNDVWFFNNNPRIVVGRNITLHDYQIAGGALNSRIVEYSYPLYSPERCMFTISEATSIGRLRNIESQIRETNHHVTDVDMTARTISRHGWRNAMELSEMFDSLKAELLLIGNEDNQFTTTSGFQANFQNNRNVVRITAGQLQHVVFPKPDGGGIWQMNEFISSEINQSRDSTPFFIYAICSRNTDSGLFVLLEDRLPGAVNDQYPNDYCFLCGMLSSVIDGRRSISPTSGFTMIAGGSITTERIQDAGQNLIIDLSADPPRITANDIVVKSKENDNGVNMLLEGLFGITQGGTGFENIVAAISGRSDDDVGIAFHRDENGNADAYNRAKDFLMGIQNRRPGTLISKGGRLFATDADLIGHIEANSGRIAGFDIDGEVLIGGSLVGDSIMVSPRSITPLGTLTDVTSDSWAYAGSRQGNLGALGFSEQSPGSREMSVINLDTEETISGNNAVGNVTRWANVGSISITGQIRLSPAGNNISNIVNNVNPNTQQNRINVRLDRIRLRNWTTGQTFIVQNNVGTNIPQGNYAIDAEINYQWTPESERDVSAGVQFRVNTRFEVLQQSGVNVARLHTNGVAVVQNASNFFYYSTQHGLEIRTPNTGFRVTSTAIQRWNGQNWVNM